MNYNKPNLIIYLDQDNNFFDFSDYDQHSKILQDIAFVENNYINYFYYTPDYVIKLMEMCLSKTYTWWR